MNKTATYYTSRTPEAEREVYTEQSSSCGTERRSAPVRKVKECRTTEYPEEHHEEKHCRTYSGHCGSLFVFFILFIFLTFIIWAVLYWGCNFINCRNNNDDCTDDEKHPDKKPHKKYYKPNSGRAFVMALVVAFILTLLLWAVSSCLY